MSRIAFIMPTFNRAHYLRESVLAIVRQMSPEDELIVIDDGSTDATPDVAKQLGASIRYIRQRNAGKSVALNRAIAETDSRYIWICDDDDVLRAGVVDIFVDTAEREGSDFVFGSYVRFREDPATGLRTYMDTGYWPDLSEGTVLRHLLEDAFIMQNAALVRRSCYEQIGPFNTSYLRSLDYEMFVRLALRVPPRYVDVIAFDQRKHDGDRGPASMLHAAAQSEHVWLQFDRRVFDDIRGSTPLSLYEAMFDGSSDPLRRRAALLQRCCVYARHDGWEHALDDLEAAIAAAPEEPLHRIEMGICTRMLNGKHGFAGARTSAAIERLRAIHGGGGVGKTMIESILAGSRWQLRRKGVAHARALARFVSDVVGVSGATRLLLMRTRARPLAPDGLLSERQKIPSDALLS